MLVSDFHFDLPEELIAQSPPEIRGSSRMLLFDRNTGRYHDNFFRNLPQILQPGDLLILNDSRVLPARLYATRARGSQTQHNSPDPSGRIEVLLTQQLTTNEWTALVRPSRKIQQGERLLFHAPNEVGPALEAEVLSASDFGERSLRFSPVPDFLAVLNKIGHMPLPPYIHREDSEADRDRYQTVFSQHSGSAAAPTAGLHFTPEIIAQLKQNGIQIETITLHVGLGTFQSVRAKKLEDIRLHSEHYTLPLATATAINTALREGRRVIAAGTTTTRTLEHCARTSAGKILMPHSGQTSIFISPGHEFKIVTGLLTNFHLPESTLLMLVSAFAGSQTGRELIRAAYEHAIQEKYRFFSYGDCMLLL
ncbi:tRNA preQ1(34) S-adenosylmethionine ribosyltransferase-isomerase QueA [Tunturiibacter gelidoferens]|uniref:S-adenosylmethionine:tRNA ribosyltransferase-isomerase n=1 Tax=Tunturiibacter gelidiferens TaxID=3069689 RepID=A0A9X0U3M7_9BACT|nr:tRNA preQ1(34) S-adenosylmethionine ribosyltransferase-isomerase QueA [Edaphobacter lichenicola]MBB5328493.1 S-adenosylmethionine:tRNA ribosyltransferase-isomerase [Edaphobacter lichenicola]